MRNLDSVNFGVTNFDSPRGKSRFGVGLGYFDVLKNKEYLEWTTTPDPRDMSIRPAVLCRCCLAVYILRINLPTSTLSLRLTFSKYSVLLIVGKVSNIRMEKTEETNVEGITTEGSSSTDDVPTHWNPTKVAFIMLVILTTLCFQIMRC